MVDLVAAEGEETLHHTPVQLAVRSRSELNQHTGWTEFTLVYHDLNY